MAEVKAGTCPICGKPTVEKFKPFCSKRCRMIDLGKWLGGAYQIPSTEETGESEPLPKTDEDEEVE